MPRTETGGIPVAAGRSDGLAAIQARLERILDPYRDRLELATIYGIPTLRRHGANAHHWFAFVKPASKHVGFFLLPIKEDPQLRAGLSPGLRRRLTGKATFTFTAIDEGEMTELASVVGRAFDRYMADA